MDESNCKKCFYLKYDRAKGLYCSEGTGWKITLKDNDTCGYYREENNLHLFTNQELIEKIKQIQERLLMNGEKSVFYIVYEEDIE